MIIIIIREIQQMAFWAMGALDKMKNITQKLNIKDVSKKVISYVAAQNEKKQQTDTSPSIFRTSQKEESISQVQPKRLLSSKQRMELQLIEYKKLVKMQEQILQNHIKKEKQALLEKQAKLEKENNSLIEQQESVRRETSKGILIEQIESGQKSIEEVITENIMIKQKILLSKNK